MDKEQEEAREQVAGDREQHPAEGTTGVAGRDVAGEAADDMAGNDLTGVRELILKAYPDVVPELLAGESLDELLASVPAARDAYTRIATTIQEQSPTPAPIPTGSGRRPAIDPEGFSPQAKIQAGLRQQSL